MVLAVTSGVYIVVFVLYNAPTRMIMSVLASRLLIVYSVLFFERVLLVHSSEEEKKIVTLLPKLWKIKEF